MVTRSRDHEISPSRCTTAAGVDEGSDTHRDIYRKDHPHQQLGQYGRPRQLPVGDSRECACHAPKAANQPERDRGVHGVRAPSLSARKQRQEDKRRAKKRRDERSGAGASGQDVAGDAYKDEEDADGPCHGWHGETAIMPLERETGDGCDEATASRQPNGP